MLVRKVQDRRPSGTLCICSENSQPMGKARGSRVASPTEPAVGILFHSHGDQPPEIQALKAGVSGILWDQAHLMAGTFLKHIVGQKARTVRNGASVSFIQTVGTLPKMRGLAVAKLNN